MPAILDEHQQWSDEAGVPFLNGSVYIGVLGLDPVLNPEPIFSDEDLTVVLANPQTLDSYGRATNKIYSAGRYSIRVNDSDGVQVYQNLDAGEVVDAGVTLITNVQGTNTITGEASPTITAYTDGETYIFTAANAITDAVTLNWDSVGAKGLVFDGNVALFRNHIIQNQKVAAVYNSTNDNFEWRNPNRKVRYGNKGADIVAASTTDLSLLVGNAGVITGNTTITSFGTTPTGTTYLLTFTGTPQITYNATSMIIPGDANITIVAGDTVLVESLGSGNNQIQVFRGTGRALVEGEMKVATSNVTRDSSLATGTVNVTGLGFTPRAVILYALENNTMEISWGFGISGSNMSMYSIHNATANQNSFNASLSGNLVETGANNTQISFSSYIAGGFTITFTKVGTPVNNVELLMLILGWE